MPIAGHHQEVEIRLWQIEESLFLEPAYEPGRTRPVVAIPPLMAALRVMKKRKQVRHQGRNAVSSRQMSSMERDTPPMACTMDALPIELERLPYPADQTGGQARWFVDGQTRRTACAL